MNPTTACRIINQNIVFAPGWEFEAVDFSERFEDAVCVNVSYPAVETNRDEAEVGYQRDVIAHAKFCILVGMCKDQVDLCRCIVTDVIQPIMLHEAREMLRMAPTFWAPFHPHKIDGMKRWGDVLGDTRFGIV